MTRLVSAVDLGGLWHSLYYIVGEEIAVQGTRRMGIWS
jgi:hypothetical protein